MPNPDSTLLSWITAEVNQALSVVREQIARYSAKAGDTALLHGCSDHLHQVSGALRMVGLNGATRFSEAIEASLGGLTAAKASRESMGVVDRAVMALKEFVEGRATQRALEPLPGVPRARRAARQARRAGKGPVLPRPLGPGAAAPAAPGDPAA
jgi:chemosensory pili system protein ChpA (sensor histidine kinase/response regulator)